MGMYTGLKVEAKIKQEYLNLVSMFLNYDFDGMDSSWSYIAKEYPFVKEFSEKSRCNFIPYGVVCYMPDDWDNGNEFDMDTGVWKFTCSLKNYEGEIECFLGTVLNVIADEADATYLYEEMASPQVYRIEGGVVYKAKEGLCPLQ